MTCDLPEGPFDLIYADPPWRFETRSDKGRSRCPDGQGHYEVMSLSDIQALPVADCAAKHAVLVLWATVPMLTQALETMAAWGFAYKSGAVWDKGRVGTGYWVRNQHELILIGTKGRPPAPKAAMRRPSVFTDPRGMHSQKPAAVRDWAFWLSPGEGRCLELFARGEAPYPWTFWGDEAE